LTADSQSQVPALIVSGFLGSGKTSLVRWLLLQSQRGGTRVAVISNEFGELGIDRALLGEGGEAFVELEGGCVCCQLSNELVETLEMLRRKVSPERIVIETSGVALPGETQMNLGREPVRSWIGDDLAVVVVNAEQVLEGRDLEGTFEYQLTSADLLLLNKIDLVPPEELPRVEALLRQIEPEAPIVRGVHGRVDPSVLFPPDAGSLHRQRRAARRAPALHAHESFAAEVVRVEAGVAEEALIARFRSLGALRVKGFVDTAAGLRLLQGVGGRVHLQRVAAVPADELRGQVVVIRRSQAADGPRVGRR
jgi:cobalamin biosynthesis protein CobW